MKCIGLVISFVLCALGASAAEVILQNSSFEVVDVSDAAKAAGWHPITETGEPPVTVVTNEDACDGTNSMKLAFASNKDGFVGVIQEVPVEPGQRLKFSGEFKRVELAEGSYLKLGIEWKRADGGEVSRVQDGDINAKTLVAGAWSHFEVAGAAPAGTAKAVLTITFYSGGKTSGAVLADKMVLETLNK
jgi:hypothetical protein